MVSVDTVAASHPCLPCPPLAETMADGLGCWLLYASVQAGCHQGGHGTTAAAMVGLESKKYCTVRLTSVDHQNTYSTPLSGKNDPNSTYRRVRMKLAEFST